MQGRTPCIKQFKHKGKLPVSGSSNARENSLRVFDVVLGVCMWVFCVFLEGGNIFLTVIFVFILICLVVLVLCVSLVDWA